MTKDILYLASQSPSRQALLQQAKITYQVIGHQSDEEVAQEAQRFHDRVLAIAQHKMQHAVLPEITAIEKDYLFVLTADSLSYGTKTGDVFGKPKDRADAKRMLKLKHHQPIEVATGCCLEKKIFDNGAWCTQEKQEWVTSGTIEFYVDEDSMDLYLENAPEALYASGAGVIENFGVNFLKTVAGSHSAVTGLPIFELRQALQHLQFQF